MKLISSFVLSLYGSSVWNLYSSNCENLYNSWNVCMRKVFTLDRCTHRGLIEPLSDTLHLKTVLLSRLKTFYATLVNSGKFELRFLDKINVQDNRTVMGMTLSNIAFECGVKLEDLTTHIMKFKMGYMTINLNEYWQENLAIDLMSCRTNHTFIDGFTKDVLEEILHYICTS